MSNLEDLGNSLRRFLLGCLWLLCWHELFLYICIGSACQPCAFCKDLTVVCVCLSLFFTASLMEARPWFQSSQIVIVCWSFFKALLSSPLSAALWACLSHLGILIYLGVFVFYFFIEKLMWYHLWLSVFTHRSRQFYTVQYNTWCPASFWVIIPLRFAWKIYPDPMIFNVTFLM